MENIIQELKYLLESIQEQDRDLPKRRVLEGHLRVLESGMNI